MEDEKQIRWVGLPYDDLLAFPKDARKETGFQLGMVPGHVLEFVVSFERDRLWHGTFRNRPKGFRLTGLNLLPGTFLFFTSLLFALTAGRAFWVWRGENPFNASGATHVEFFQQLDKLIVLPIAVTGIGGTLLAGVSATL